MAPQRHEDGTRFPDESSSETYGIDFDNLHRREGEIAPPTQEWLREFKLAQAAAQLGAETKKKPPTPQEDAANTILQFGVIEDWRRELAA